MPGPRTPSSRTNPEGQRRADHARLAPGSAVADGVESGKLDEAVKVTNRYAVYAIRSIENPERVSDVTKPPATKKRTA